MQMYYIKIVFIVLLGVSFNSSCLAATEFSQYFQLQPPVEKSLADNITRYYSEDIQLSAEKQKAELLQMQQQLLKLSASHEKQAAYWFLRGLNHQNLAAVYAELNAPELAEEQLKSKTRAYKKALQLDSRPPRKLSAAIYSTIKIGLPAELKIQAIQGELAQGGNGDNDSYYWYLHWSNIDQLEKAGRSEEARAAYRKMKKEMKDSQVDMSVYGQFEKQIEQKTLQQSKPEKVVRKSQKTEKETDRKSTIDKKYIILYVLSFISIAAIIGVTVYEIRKKGKGI